MIDAALQALVSFLDPMMLTMLLVGVLAGVFFGLIPGVSGTGAVALLMPFVLQMPPAQALALMIGALSVVHTSDTISAVLLGAPTSASSAVTMLDGHAFALKGQAGRALSVAFLSSMAGGILGAVGLTLSIPIARPLVLAFGAPELFMLCVMGISFATTLSEGQVTKGLLSALVGVFLGMIGAASNAAEYRYTLGSTQLMDGLPLVAVALGIFGLAEIADLLGKGGAIATRVAIGSGWMDGVRDFLRYKWHVLRGALIGIWAGVLPGIGATAGTFMAYGQAYATAKDKSNFGKGDVRGIIGPESANNAVEAGDLIPTLLFSIPGGTPSAILMGVLMMYGIQPGPRMVTDHLDIVYTIVWSFALSSVIGAAICFLISPVLARLTYLPFFVLAPGLTVLMLLGAYQDASGLGDLVVMVLLGLTGWILKQTGYPRAPLLIGFVLALPIERYYWLTVKLYGNGWFTRPWVIVMAVLLVLSIVWSLRTHGRNSEAKNSEAGEADEDEGHTGQADTRWAAAVSVALLLVFTVVLVTAFTYSREARLMPVLAGIVAVGLAAIQVNRDLRLHLRKPVATPLSERQKSGLTAFVWLGGLLALTWLFGFSSAVLVFVTLFLRAISQMKWWKIATYDVAVMAGLTLLNWALGVTWPEGIYNLF